MAKKPAHSPDTARKIWLAGIGAYGRAFSEAQEQVAKLGGSSARGFDERVAKGEAIEKTVEARGRKVAAKLAPGAHSFDERIKKMRERIMHGEDDASLADEVGELRARVASLGAKVKTLSGARAAPKRKAVRKKKA